MSTFFLDTNHSAICAQALLAAMARRHPRHTFVSAQFATNLLLREGESVSLDQVEESMHQLQRQALGVVVEDESENIGFLWEQAPCVALARKQLADQFMPTLHDDVVRVDTLRAYQDPLPEHVLQLRDNCAVRVSMPTDLNDDEFQRVAHFVMALVDSDYITVKDSWPFPSARKKTVEEENVNDDLVDVDDFGDIYGEEDQDAGEVDDDPEAGEKQS